MQLPSLQRARAYWDRLAARERRLLLLLSSVLAFGLVGSLVATISGGISDLEEHNRTTREALHAFDLHRDELAASVRAETAMEARVQSTAPALTGYLEQVAADAGISIPESRENPAAKAGKQLTERSVVITIRGVTVQQLDDFLARVEDGPHLVVVKKLDVTPRYNQHDQLDVEMTVSTYERTETKGAAGGGKGAEPT